VFINTASEYDGSDSGASPDEAVSWGKIKRDAKPVKVNLNRFKFIKFYFNIKITNIKFRYFLRLL
jgi:hypothetical protein